MFSFTLIVLNQEPSGWSKSSLNTHSDIASRWEISTMFNLQLSTFLCKLLTETDRQVADLEWNACLIWLCILTQLLKYVLDIAPFSCISILFPLNMHSLPFPFSHVFLQLINAAKKLGFHFYVSFCCFLKHSRALLILSYSNWATTSFLSLLISYNLLEGPTGDDGSISYLDFSRDRLSWWRTLLITYIYIYTVTC